MFLWLWVFSRLLIISGECSGRLSVSIALKKSSALCLEPEDVFLYGWRFIVFEKGD
jgi:hypothetical protein